MIMAMEEGREVDILQEVMRYSGMEAGELLDSGPDWPRTGQIRLLGPRRKNAPWPPFFALWGGLIRARVIREEGVTFMSFDLPLMIGDFTVRP